MGKVMRVRIIGIILIVLSLGLVSFHKTSATVDPCAAVTAESKVMWGKQELKPYQVGKVTFLKKTSLYKLAGSKKTTVRVGESLRVYAIQSTRLDLGNGLFVPRDKKIKLEKASSKQQQKAMCVRTKKLEKSAEQMLVVKASSKDKTKATLQRYEKKNGKWVKVSSSMKAIVGKNGLGKTKEGDGRIPKGTYSLGESFGWGEKPSNLSFPFRKVTKHDYWVDYTKTTDYNKWIKYTGDPYRKWKSFERLTHPLYKYAVVIRYNDDPIINGAGSAIFLHTKNKNTRYTLGCVAISEKDLVKIIKWLKPTSKPIIKIEG